MSAMNLPTSEFRDAPPIRVLALCHVGGGGGGVDRILLRTAATIDPRLIALRICCIRRAGDSQFDLDCRAKALGIDYCEVTEKSRFDMSIIPTLRNITKGFNPSIIDSHQYKTNFLAWRLTRGNKTLAMATCHGWTGHHWRERFIYYPIDRRILRRFAVCLAVSSEIKERLVRNGCKADRINVILNAINANEFKRRDETRMNVRRSLGVKPDDIVLGAVGRIEQQKRFDILLDTLVLLNKINNRDYKLFIIGEGSQRVKLEKYVTKLGLNGCCSILGYRNDVKDLYQAFDVLVQSSDYEGTPTVLVEAMALKVPVVATDAGGTSELAEDSKHALIVPCGSPNALAAAIELTLNDGDATKIRVAAARQRVESELSFEARTRRLETIYLNLAGISRSPMYGEVAERTLDR